MRVFWVVALAGGLVGLAVAGAAAADEGNLTIRVQADGNATASDPEGLVENRTSEPGERYRWTLNLTRDDHTARVHVDRNFPIDRGRQLVPQLDGAHFVEVREGQVAEVDRPATVFNLTAANGTWTYDLGLEGPGEANLTLHRDLTAPELEVVSVGNRSHIGFDVVTNTSENALALLIVNGPDEDIQRYPTPRPGPWQKFPVQGLNPDKAYRFQVNATDWSGNNATGDYHTVRTTPAPDPPEPDVQPVSPEPNATVSPDDVVVRASWSSPESPVPDDGIRLFFDKERVDPDDFEVADGTLTYHPQGRLAERTYFVSLEIENSAGGEGLARWSFDAQVPRSTPTPTAASLLAFALAGLALAARRPGEA